MLVKEYAKLRKVTPVAVTRALKKGKNLVGVVSYRKVGRDWVLTVLTKEAEKTPKKYLVI